MNFVQKQYIFCVTLCFLTINVTLYVINAQIERVQKL